MSVKLLSGDCLDILPTLEADSIDACVTDPPYHLITEAPTSRVKFGTKRTDADRLARRGFMGKQWDGGDVAFRPETWAEVFRVLKPGAHLLAFGGTRTYHRMVCAIEDAGFEIRDCIQWLYGSGFPKSHDISKSLDRAAGAERGRYERPAFGGTFSDDNGTTYGTAINSKPITSAARQWEGWGTALKPACEPIVLARKPLSEPTVAANVLRWGTGAINVDGCRVETADNLNGGAYSGGNKNLADATSYATGVNAGKYKQPTGRWPANVIHDGSEEVVGVFPDVHGAGTARKGGAVQTNNGAMFGIGNHTGNGTRIGDSGSAARFFYCAKANKSERNGSKHPTVKPLKLMRYLVRLITPPAGIVLDPFAGTGTTGQAATEEGMRAILIEREAEYQGDIRRRVADMPMRLAV